MPTITKSLAGADVSLGHQVRDQAEEQIKSNQRQDAETPGTTQMTVYRH